MRMRGVPPEAGIVPKPLRMSFSYLSRSLHRHRQEQGMTRPIYVMMCTALMATPCFLPKAERRYATLPALLGAFGLLASILTDRASPRLTGFNPSRELSEAVADPGNHIESTTFFD
jgi:hypothetical protein